MKGKKALLTGSEMSGYSLTEISKRQYADLVALIHHHSVGSNTGSGAANREISSMDEAPYKRLKKTPAYEKLSSGRSEQIVETDFLYFYGIIRDFAEGMSHDDFENKFFLYFESVSGRDQGEEVTGRFGTGGISADKRK
jgi:hypothetical protein